MKRFVLRVPFALLAVSCLVVGCKRKTDLGQEQGAGPPPEPSRTAGVCRSGGGKVGDAASAAFFPRQVAGYCIDPNGETRAYGKESKNPLDQVCLEQFDGECEVYKGYGLDRVVTLRYVDGRGTMGEVGVSLARFETKDGSYGFFTRRVSAGQDPARSQTKPLAAGGEGAIGSGIAYVWRGLYVAQLSYSNTDETPEQLAATSARVLPKVAKALGEHITGETLPPRAVRLLPTDERLPLGVTYEFGDALGVQGVGIGAVGHYAEGAKRWQALVIARTDADSAKDIMKTFRRLDGAKKFKGLPFDAVGFALKPNEASPAVRWIVAQRAERVVGIGDEPLVLGPDVSPEEVARLTLSKRDKLARVQQLLVTTGSRAPASGSAPAPSGRP